jgi:hypothetical protein
MWDDFLKNIKSDKSSFYIPLRRNGIIKDKGAKAENFEAALKENEDFKELYQEVSTHPLYKGSLPPTELNEKIKRYKYGVVFRCVSINDSLNFKPVLYAYNDIVPILDFRYDPEYLQIPKEIQDKLVVHSGADIDAKIDFYNKNDDKRVQVLHELKELFRINKYIHTPEQMVQESILKIFN